MSFFEAFCCIRRLSLTGLRAKNYLGGISIKLVKDITEIVIQQQSESLRILNIESELETKNIFIITETDITVEQKSFKRFFYQKVSPIGDHYPK
jgi:polyphosphate kinase